MTIIHVNMDFKHWKKVRELIDVGKSSRNRTFLRDYCLRNKDLFNYSSTTFHSKIGQSSFSNEQERYIWKYLVENHPDKVQQVLLEVEAEKKAEAEIVEETK